MNPSRGFTLIELLVVVAIIALLSSVVLATTTDARQRAALSRAKAFASHLDRSLGDQVISSWSLSDGAGAIVRDVAGTMNGTVVGATWATDTPWGSGSSLFFNGSSYVTIPYKAALAPTSVVSYGGWFKPTDNTSATRLLSKTEVGGYFLGFNSNAGGCDPVSMCGLVNIGGLYYSANYPSKYITPNVWHHGFVVYDGSTISLYLDGARVAVATTPGGAITYSRNNELCIGVDPVDTCAGNEGFYFKGWIDDVRVFGKALVASEVNKMYALGLPQHRA